MKLVEKEWGTEEIIVTNEHYTGKFLNIKSGQQTSKQYHREKHETLLLNKGKAEVLLNGVTKIVDAEIDSIEARTFVIPPNNIHMTKAVDGDCQFIEFSTSHLSDCIRISDIYGRIE